MPATAVEPKYTVYPRQEPNEPLAEGTYFVLRDSDILATSLLWAYVSEIQTVLELDHQRGFLSDEERAHLRQTEDQVTVRARGWQLEGKGRLPT